MPPTQTDHTLVMHPALDHTLAAEDARSLAISGEISTTLVRTTVLPRVESSMGAHSIVVDAKERYVDERLLGEGGVGEVVCASDNDIARPVAIKRLKRNMKSQATLLRFVEEIRTIGQLEHANIVPIHDVGVDARGDYFFVMKYVEGETLEAIIEKLAAGDRAYHAIYNVEHRLRIFSSILDAIAHAHAKGYVHRDIKPANIMVGVHGQVMVMDWGLAKRKGAPEIARDATTPHAPAPEAKRFHETVAGSILGTPAYMSPEQARGEEATEASDIYSLTVLLYELLTLHHPLEDCTTLEAMLDAVQHRKTRMAGLVTSPHQRRTPMDLAWYLTAGLEKDPSRRYRSVQAMIDRLDLRARGIVPVQCHITFAKRASGMLTRAIDSHPIPMTFAMLFGLVGSIASFGWLLKSVL